MSINLKCVNLISRSWRGCEVLSMLLSSFCSILLSTTTSRGARAVSITESAFLMTLLSLLVSLALQTPAKKLQKLHWQRQTDKICATSFYAR